MGGVKNPPPPCQKMSYRPQEIIGAPDFLPSRVRLIGSPVSAARAYGPPSQRTSEGATWAWGQDGFIPDLDGQPLHEITTVSQFGSRKTIQYRPCSTGFSADAEYRFRQHRETPIMPGCVALFRFSYSGGAQLSTVSFSLTDFDLIRQHVAEVDRQILEALTSDAPVAPADMDL